MADQPPWQARGWEERRTRRILGPSSSIFDLSLALPLLWDAGDSSRDISVEEQPSTRYSPVDAHGGISVEEKEACGTFMARLPSGARRLGILLNKNARIEIGWSFSF